MNTIIAHRRGGKPRRLALVILGALLSCAPPAVRAAEKISDAARGQIASLIAEKQGRTAAQRKMDSQLVYHLKQSRNLAITAAVPSLKTSVRADHQNRVLVDLKATVTESLVDFIVQSGGSVVSEVAGFDAVRAWLPVNALEALAARPEVRFVEPAAEYKTNIGPNLTEGDRTHRADTARATFGVDGTDIKIGVLSNGVNSLPLSKSQGDLNASATVIAGQAGSGNEGAAMMELIQDLLPGAQLYFATGTNGTASFASNILALQAAGCSVIVDDISYFNESPFQDAVISQAVNTVSAAGVMYFSSAGNSGNKNDGTSGTWEGDFMDGGAAGAPLPAVGNVHDFGGGTTFDTITSSVSRVDLFWADPLGGSNNDYDLFILDSTGTSVEASSTNIQSGVQDPYESNSSIFLSAGMRVVIVKNTGAADRFLHLDAGTARLAINTEGKTRGHNASGAANAFSVAATNVVNSPAPLVFSGGATNPVETFSSDGPRRMFFQPDGAPFTPGNFSSTGGLVLNKPDITAADGVTTGVSGFTSFFGTSAASPHAAAIAAMLKAYNPALSPAQIRTLLTTTALDIEAPGVDRDSGTGIVMAHPALQAAPAPDVLAISTTGLDATGPLGGPFSPSSGTYTLTNTSGSPVNWSAASTQPWNTISPGGGTLAPGNSIVVTCAFTPAAGSLPIGSYMDTVTITNTDSGFSRNLSVNLVVQGFSGTGLGAIPDGTDPTPPAYGAPLVISFPVSGVASSVTQVTVDLALTHTAAGDLDMVLASPGGARSLVLVSRLGVTTATGTGSSANFNGEYAFTDLTGGTNIWTAASGVAAIPAGAYRTTEAGADGQTNPPPVTSLIATFGGMTPAEANGTWTLTIRDARAGNTGSVSSAMLSVITSPVPSSNADLSNLVPGTGSLSPAFASGTVAYSLSVANAVTNITVTPTTADAGATVQVNVNGGVFADVTSGSPSGPLALDVGVNQVNVRVQAQDGFTLKTYTIFVVRAGWVTDLVLPCSSTVSTNLMRAPIRAVARTLQVVFSSSFFSGVPVGSTITGIAFRLAPEQTTWPASDRSWTNYDIQISTSLQGPGSLSTTFADNIAPDVVTTRSGPLTMPANSYVGEAAPNPFGPVITFTSPFVYTGGDLLITIRHTGNGVDDRFCDAPADIPGYFQSVGTTGASGGYTATTGSFAAASPVVRLSIAPPPGPHVIINDMGGDVVTGSDAPDAAGTASIGKFDALKRGGFLAENGQLVFPGYLLVGSGSPPVTMSPNSFMGLWKDDGSGLKLFARSGNAASEAGGALFDVLPQVPAINDSGEVTFLASLAIGSGAPATTADDDTGLWSELGSTGIGILLREGDPIPGLSGIQVGRFASGAYATAKTGASTGEATFSITMKGGSTDTAILRASITGPTVTAIGVVARENTAMPGVAGEMFGNLASTYSDAQRMDATGNLVFAALTKTTARESIWYQPVTPAGGAPVKVYIAGTAVTGDTAPDTTGATFKNIKSPAIGGEGTMTFRGFLNNNGDNAAGLKNDGIWRGTTAGGFTCILRRGDDNTNRPGLGLPAGAKVGNLWHSWLTNANHGAWKGWLDVGGDGTSSTASGDVNAIYTDLSGTMTLMTKVGDAAPNMPAGANFASFDLPIVGGTEQCAFLGTVTGGGTSSANNKGVWRSAANGGALSLVLRTGDTLTTTQGTKTIQNVDFPGSGSTDRRWEQPVMDATGRLLVYVTFTDGSTTQVLVP